MKHARVLLFVVPVLLLGCNSWGSSSGWERRPELSEPDFEIEQAETQGSYTPIESSDED